MSNRFNSGKQNLNQNPKFPNTKPKPFTKKVTQIWVKKKETRNWLDLPRDIMLHIFLKIGLIHLLSYTQYVCSLWRDIARDPILYRRIDYFSEELTLALIRGMAMEAIHRSCGQLDDFSMLYNATDQMLLRMVETSCRLKRLRLAKCSQVSDGVLVQVVKKMPSLETVELCICSFTTQVIEAVGRACPGLKSFRLNRRAVFPHVQVIDEFDDEALAIANTMPGLQSLHLFGNLMTNTGLQAILDKCPHLEYLDIRKCCNVDMRGDLLAKCRQIKILKLPSDSTP